jgi:ABC-type sugar transport system, permease component
MKEIRITTILQRIFVYFIGMIFLAPFLISILLSFKTKQETTINVLSLPSKLHWENYMEAMKKANIIHSMMNSFIITVGSVLLVLIVSAMAGYGIARRYSNKWVKAYESLLLAALMIPFQTLMIPIYRMFKNMNLLNTWQGAIILIAGFNMPFAVMMFIGFIRTLPYELEEAAIIEGCGRFKIFFHIVFPLIKPITATIAVLDALWAWNEFNVSLLILQKNVVKTIPIQQYVFFGEHSSDYNMAFAAAVISMIPITIFFILSQKHIVEGMTAGAVKG